VPTSGWNRARRPLALPGRRHRWLGDGSECLVEGGLTCSASPWPPLPNRHANGTAKSHSGALVSLGASGAIAVQIVYSSRRGSASIEHLGSAHDDAELEALKAAAHRDLRHTFVSLMSADGVPIEEIARLAGHNRTATTELV
jgi:hypothetical protein